MVAGLLLEMIAWGLVARGRNIWTTMPPVLGLMGLAALLIGPPAWSPDVSAGASLVLGGFEPTEASADFNPLLTSAGLASWIALGMVGATALIAVLIRATLKGARSSAVQAATGFFYLAVITALTAEFAAKVAFLP